MITNKLKFLSLSKFSERYTSKSQKSMNCNRTLVSILIMAIAGICYAGETATPTAGVSVKIVPDRPEATYALGEKAVFTFTLLRDGQPVSKAELLCRLTKDSMTRVDPLELAGTTDDKGVATVTATLNEPGFLNLRVDFRTPEGQNGVAVRTVAFDPFQIKPSMPVPDDFDAFWAEQKRLLAAVPMNPRLAPIPMPKQPDVECFDIQVDCLGGKPVSGYYTRPKGANPKSLPAELFLPGVGVRSAGAEGSGPEGRNREAARGRLVFDINAHGIPNGKPREFYDALNKGELKDYLRQGLESRDTYYCRGMFLRVMRALDFLCAQPEWDGRVLIARGGSQGGAQALAAAGLDPRVTAFYAGVPALCDHSANVVGRQAGYPRLVPLGPDGKPDPVTLQVSRYFDGMNFAARTRADAIMAVGFQDAHCPPWTAFATYSNISGRKQIVTSPEAGHEGPRDSASAVDAFINDHIARRQADKN